VVSADILVLVVSTLSRPTAQHQTSTPSTDCYEFRASACMHSSNCRRARIVSQYFQDNGNDVRPRRSLYCISSSVL